MRDSEQRPRSSTASEPVSFTRLIDVHQRPIDFVTPWVRLDRIRVERPNDARDDVVPVELLLMVELHSVPRAEGGTQRG